MVNILLYVLQENSLLKNSSKVLAVMLAAFIFLTACIKEYSYEKGPEDKTATGSLISSSGNCGPITSFGVYREGSQPGDTNYLEVQVHFTSPGRYQINTNTQNGISFQDSGLVRDTGYHTITLKARGNPIRAQTTHFTVAFDTSRCNFSIDVAPVAVAAPTPVNRADSTWSFFQGTQFFHGYFDGALTHLVNGTTMLTLVGLTQTKDTAIAILVHIVGSSSVKTGAYKTTISSSFSFFDYTGNSIYLAEKTTPGAEVTITITAYDPATKILQGTFNGTVLNKTNDLLPITGGKFKAQLD